MSEEAEITEVYEAYGVYLGAFIMSLLGLFQMLLLEGPSQDAVLILWIGFTIAYAILALMVRRSLGRVSE